MKYKDISPPGEIGPPPYVRRERAAKRIEVMYYVLIASCIIYICSSMWADLRVGSDPYPIHVHDTDTVRVERLPCPVDWKGIKKSVDSIAAKYDTLYVIEKR